MTTDGGLYPYQETGADYLSLRRRAILGDVPGLGKTRQALAAAARLNVPGLLVVCPAIVRPVWFAEWQAMKSPFSLAVESYQRLVVNEGARAELAGRDRSWPLVLDEFHYLKSTTSQRSKLILGKGGLAAGRSHVWALSGTPMPRNPLDLWPALYSLFPERLVAAGIRNKAAFLREFCVYRITPYGVRVFAVRNRDRLRAILEPIMIRRHVEDVLPDLPSIRWDVLPIDGKHSPLLDEAEALLTPQQRASIMSGVLPPLIDGPMATVRRLLGEAKAPLAADLLEAELSADEEPHVIIAYHHSVLDILEARLHTVASLERIDGSTPARERANIIDRFQRGETRVLLGQITAAGTGITLHRANVMTIVEPDWTADANVQVGKRIHRIGQTRSCQVRFLTWAGTLDEQIMRSHHREVKMVEEVLGRE